MFKKISPPFLGFLQATGLVMYIILLSFFFTFITSSVTPVFRNINAQFYAPIIMLILFVLSAVISGLLVLGRAGFLFWEKKYKESFTLIGWTVGWIFFYFVLFILTLYFI